MQQQTDMKALYDTADKFIALANELAQKDPSGTVGTAIRYAAARYSAFEASMLSQDLASDKEKMKALFGEDFARMLEENLNVYIRHLAQQAE